MAQMTRVVADRRTIDLSHPDKQMFPIEWSDDPVTKADLVDYYRRIASVMVPHLRDRPLVMTRYPDGIAGHGFYQKDVPDYFPDWIRRAEMPREQGGTVTHVVCDDEATLAYLATQACITPHIWPSRADDPYRPDRLVFDLDPSQPGFDPVRFAARALRSLLGKLDLVPFVQTTGSSGLHVVVPIEPEQSFDEVRELARAVAHRLVTDSPRVLTEEQRKAKRGGRVYVDIMRNAYAQSYVAPYALRSLQGAPVATPLDWVELNDGKLGPQSYNLRNIFRRLGQRDDPWDRMDDHARPLANARRKLAHLADDPSR